MPLVPLTEVLKDAQAKKYAVPGFNFHLYEDLVAIVEAAQEARSPVILMAAGTCMKHWGPTLAAALIKEVADRVDIPVVAHLDHASSLELIFKSIHAGFTSVMYDGSMLPVEENIANSKIVVKVARAFDVSVEAELGRVAKGEEGESAVEILTDPSDVVMFCEATDVDALAVAVGTVHGMQKQEAKIHLDLVDAISEVSPVPLVLHGSSGVSDNDLRYIATTGFSKINIGTRLKTVFTEGIREVLQNDPDLNDQLKLLKLAVPRVKDTVKEKIELLGSGNRV
ncbi:MULTISPECIES: class II fructose-bisphosphate aldolase [Mesotoga]|uniref:class II fructose-bisphosphate aldolase n=2 Tax=Kosmotogaceae TaxID=1643948 RepID=UPI000C17ADC6|nr:MULTISPECIES: class II fructose-bisphosphate aldolase [Mesotoga]MDK2944863.1 tagatose 1,6-diphosphate aldolase GatY/KbaY [Mesotoga sp.]PIJ61072.1 ketose-bisphosphate aldolase [Mesotoga sp. H07.pep.5.3]HPQ92002.1 class II fructose-bisphosphate aldolase [Mesotoga prima]